jgi:hypothetical protein
MEKKKPNTGSQKSEKRAFSSDKPKPSTPKSQTQSPPAPKKK